MLTKSSILKIKEQVTHWPDNQPQHFKCTLVGRDGAQFDADLHKTEVELKKFLASIGLKKAQLSKLIDLIDNYGQHKYEEGGNSEAMSNADASL